jgi:hypothetical protein
MATQMNDDGTVSDEVTKETQKGYSNYESGLKKAQEKMLLDQQKTKDKYTNLLERGMEILGRKKREPEEDNAFINIGRGMTQGAEDYAKKPKGMKKGGMVKSASARADGCAIRGKTRA